MLTTQQLREAWAPPCNAAAMRSVEIVQGVRVQCHQAAATAMKALGRVMEAHGYAIRQSDTGAYNCRQITGGSGHSLHSYGIAVDVNWNSNPYRADNRLITDMSRAMVDAILKIRTVNGKQVFRWGGDYQNVKDAMHYEVVCAPLDLSTGIDWATVEQAELAPAKPHDWPLIQRGDRGAAVEELQRRLGIAAAGQPGFGTFGPKTEAAVRAYQAAHGLEADGRVGRQTWIALLTDQPAVAANEPGPVKRQPSGTPPSVTQPVIAVTPNP